MRTVRGLTMVWRGPAPDGPGAARSVSSSRDRWTDRVCPEPRAVESLAAYVDLVASGPARRRSLEHGLLDRASDPPRSGPRDHAPPQRAALRRWRAVFLDAGRARAEVREVLLPTRKLRCVRLSPALQAALTGAAWKGTGPFDPSFGQSAGAVDLAGALSRRGRLRVGRRANRPRPQGRHLLAGLVREAAPRPCLPGQGWHSPRLARLSSVLGDTAASRWPPS